MKMNFSFIFEQGFLLRSTKIPINVVKVMHGVLHCVNSPLNLFNQPPPPPSPLLSSFKDHGDVPPPCLLFMEQKSLFLDLLISFTNSDLSKHFSRYSITLLWY